MHGVVYGAGYGTRVGIGRAIPGYYPPSPQTARGASPDSVAGPGSPARAGVGGQGAADALGTVPGTHPPGPVSPAPRAFPGACSLACRLLANKGEI